MRTSTAVARAIACLLALFLIYEWSRPDVLLVGYVTVDIVGNTTPTGGAVSYAAAALGALGLRACVVTVAGPDADLSVFARHELHVVASELTLTFEHTYTWFGNARRLHVPANPNITLTVAHVPPRCRRARVVIAAPLTLYDVDAASLLQHDGGWVEAALRGYQHVGLLAQGFQRSIGAGGRVEPMRSPSPQLLAGLSPAVSLFLSDVETDEWAPGALASVAARSGRTLITRGDKGATELSKGHATDIPPVHVPRAADTNGAGDTFATAYMVALAWGHGDPGAAASWAGSRAVLMPQSCKPHCAGEHLHEQPPPSHAAASLLPHAGGAWLPRAAGAWAWRARTAARARALQASHALEQLSAHARSALQGLAWLLLRDGGGGGGGGPVAVSAALASAAV
ncbi:hypothetical protein FOA52_010651 [Chlamydomonas sp. UWO 241]|nr:hypothetical protein FOA52_010651 [Chlamydomonas sp. UWO 241]